MTVQEAVNKIKSDILSGPPSVVNLVLAVVISADEYVRERENPAPDFNMRKIRFDHLKAQLDKIARVR